MLAYIKTSNNAFWNKRLNAVYRFNAQNMSTQDYTSYYESQMGGQLTVYRGGPQSGAGLGDVLRGLFRFLAPVAARGIRAFAGNTLAATQAGVPLGAAARAALGPTISAVAGTAAPTVSRFMNAVVPGLVPGHAPGCNGGHGPYGYGGGDDVPPWAMQEQEGAGAGALFEGVDGIPVTDKAIRDYKREGAHAPSADMSTVATHGKRAATAKHKKQPPTKTVHYNF